MVSLGDLLAAAGNNSERDDDGPQPLPEATVAALQELYGHVKTPCPFKPGDLVTVRDGLNFKSEGQPAIVLEVRDEPIRNFDAADPTDTCTFSFGRAMNVRAMTRQGGSFVTYWYEHWQLEPYTGPGA